MPSRPMLTTPARSAHRPPRPAIAIGTGQVIVDAIQGKKMTQFRERYRNARVVVLRRNYRSLRPILDHVKDEVEAMTKSVIGIRNFFVIEVMGKIHEKLDPLVGARRCKAAQIVKIALVHRQDEVKIFNILHRDLACSQFRQIVAPCQGSPLRSRVRWLTHMIAMRSRRINFNFITQSIDFNEMPEDAFGGG